MAYLFWIGLRGLLSKSGVLSVIAILPMKPPVDELQGEALGPCRSGWGSVR